MAMPKPTTTPTSARLGNSNVSRPSASSPGDSAENHPAVALASSNTNRTAVAVIVPLTVISPPRHVETGPSVTGAPGGAGGAHTAPPGLGAVGAAQPACASASRLSFRTRFAITTPRRECRREQCAGGCIKRTAATALLIDHPDPSRDRHLLA